LGGGDLWKGWCAKKSGQLSIPPPSQVCDADAAMQHRGRSMCGHDKCLLRGKLYVALLKSYISYFGKFRRMKVTIVSAILVPGSNPHPDTFFLATFHVTAILAISA
jgi:hypothetical protein